MNETYATLLKSMIRGFSRDNKFRIEVEEILKKYSVISTKDQAELLRTEPQIYQEIKDIVVSNLFNENNKIINDAKCIRAVSKWSMFDIEYLQRNNQIATD